MIRSLFVALLLISSMALSAHAQSQIVIATGANDMVKIQDDNAIDELDPFDPNVNETLQQMDQNYQEETGSSPFSGSFFGLFSSGCQRAQCPVWAQVSISRQRLYLYLNGSLSATWLVSTGRPGHDTPTFDTHPDGRIYDSYTSKKFPGGDYKGLGNMPYAVFISGGFAVHGTGVGSWKKLGTPASHGCVRIHPDNAYYFNRLVRQQGVSNVWITVQN